MLFNIALIYFCISCGLPILEVHDNGNKFSPGKTGTGCSLVIYVLLRANIYENRTHLCHSNAPDVVVLLLIIIILLLSHREITGQIL